MDRASEYAARLFLAWLNERYGHAFAPASLEGNFWRASEQAGDVALVVAELSEPDDAWLDRCEELSARLDESRPGSYLLWQPPGAELPAEEPLESEWVRRVVLAASKLASGRVGEARPPRKLARGTGGGAGGGPGSSSTTSAC